MILILSILTGQAKTFHIQPNYINCYDNIVVVVIVVIVFIIV